MVYSGDEVYLLLSGKVNCLLGRNICFKKYVEGSYFGDIEFMGRMRRLFSIRAEVPTVLVALPTSKIEAVFKSHHQSLLNQWRRTIKRYLHFKLSMRKAFFFRMITNNSDWWEVTNHKDLLIFSKMQRWFDEVAARAAVKDKPRDRSDQYSWLT